MPIHSFHSHFHDVRGNELHGGMHIHSVPFPLPWWEMEWVARRYAYTRSSIPTSMMGEGMSCTAVCIYTPVPFPLPWWEREWVARRYAYTLSSIPTSMMGEGMSCTAVCIYTQFHSHFHDGRGNELHGGMHIHPFLFHFHDVRGNELHGGMHIHSVPFPLPWWEWEWVARRYAYTLSSIPTSMMGEGMSCTAVCIYTPVPFPLPWWEREWVARRYAYTLQFHSHLHDWSGNGTGVYLHTTVQLYYATTVIKTVSTLLWHSSDKQMYGVYQSKVRTVLIYKYREFTLTASHKPQIWRGSDFRMIYINNLAEQYWACINHSDAETGIFRENQVNTMPADALDPCVSRTSAAMVHQSTMEDKRDLVFHEEIFQLPASIVSNDKNAYKYFFS